MEIGKETEKIGSRNSHASFFYGTRGDDSNFSKSVALPRSSLMKNLYERIMKIHRNSFKSLDDALTVPSCAGDSVIEVASFSFRSKSTSSCPFPDHEPLFPGFVINYLMHSLAPWCYVVRVSSLARSSYRKNFSGRFIAAKTLFFWGMSEN